MINVFWVRPISEVKRVQQRCSVLDVVLELKCALCWAAVAAVMIHDGISVYGHGKWNGALIALIVCALVMM